MMVASSLALLLFQAKLFETNAFFFSLVPSHLGVLPVSMVMMMRTTSAIPSSHEGLLLLLSVRVEHLLGRVNRIVLRLLNLLLLLLLLLELLLRIDKVLSVHNIGADKVDVVLHKK
jgi:hypothetical protein